MSTKTEGAGARACWFVGATYGGTDDQTPHFLHEGIWKNGYQWQGFSSSLSGDFPTIHVADGSCFIFFEMLQICYGNITIQHNKNRLGN